MIQCGTLIQPLLNLLRDHLRDGPLIHCDETPVQVLKERDKPPESTSYMWVQVGGEPERPVILFDYDPSRSGSVPERLLADWKGALMTDGYDGYNAVAATPGVVHLACWAHARRRFIEAQRAQPKGKTGKADVAIGLIGKLYAIERRIAGTEVDVRQQAREHESRPVLAELRNWLDKALPGIPPQECAGDRDRLSAQVLAATDALYRRPALAHRQQPRRERHSPLCDRSQKLAVQRYAERCSRQCPTLQPDRNRPRQRPGALHLLVSRLYPTASSSIPRRLRGAATLAALSE